MKMVWLVPGFPQFILSPYLLTDEYAGLVPGFPLFILSSYTHTDDYMVG
jgi:hypothetical protein